MKYAAYNEYKTSGSNWLDAVPSHWNVKPLKLIVKMPITDGPHETPEFVPDGVPFASVEAVWDGKVHLSSVRGYISEDDHRRYGKKYHPKKGDIFIVKSGSTTGKVAIVDFDDDFNVWSPLMRIQSYPRGQTEVVSWEAVPERFDRGTTMDWHAQLITLSCGLYPLASGGLGAGPAPRALCRPGLHRRRGRHDLPVRRRLGTEAADQGHPPTCRALLAGLVPPVARLRRLRAAPKPACGLLAGPGGAVLRDGRGGKKLVTTEKMVFPRYHQLDAVRALVAAARTESAGHNYLIQHSAGSGKTNSISWLSHRLASLHNAQDQKVFDCVIVITDRKVLDKQLQDAIYQIEHAQGVVKAIDQDAKQLADALIDGTKIVITTLQKFPFVLRGLLHAAGAENQDKASDEEKAQAKAWQAAIAVRRYAVIVDEAHSSQTGETARELKGILGASARHSGESRNPEIGGNPETESWAPAYAGATNGEDEPDWEDRLNQIMASRGQQKNLSFFAFTATPKGKTLELFGREGASGKPEAFHTYSMRQAIEEEFILDVLCNYTTYSTWFKFVKTVEDDPAILKKNDAKALAKFKELHPPMDRDNTVIKIGNEVELHYYPLRLGVRKLSEDLMLQRTAFPMLAREIFEAIRQARSGSME